MTPPFTPFFIQIVAAGTGAGTGNGSRYLFGLTPNGQVYEWQYARDTGTDPRMPEGKMRWVLLENPHDQG